MEVDKKGVCPACGGDTNVLTKEYYMNIAKKPKIVCLCGSTRFTEEFKEAAKAETLSGNIVLTVHLSTKPESEMYYSSLASFEEKELDQIREGLDQLHFKKINIADEILVINVDGYIGESTQREIQYAKSLGKSIRYYYSN